MRARFNRQSTRRVSRRRRHAPDSSVDLRPCSIRPCVRPHAFVRRRRIRIRIRIHFQFHFHFHFLERLKRIQTDPTSFDDEERETETRDARDDDDDDRGCFTRSTFSRNAVRSGRSGSPRTWIESCAKTRSQRRTSSPLFVRACIEF